MTEIEKKLRYEPEGRCDGCIFLREQEGKCGAYESKLFYLLAFNNCWRRDK